MRGPKPSKKYNASHTPELLTNKKTFHHLLTEGIPVSKRENVDDRGDRVCLIDFKNPHNPITTPQNRQWQYCKTLPTTYLYPIA